jgi:hypothetical protein
MVWRSIWVRPPAAGRVCLRRAGQYVTAIDPGDLDTRLADDPGVRHRRITAEQYLQSDPDTFDIIVNDMRMDARDSARVMAAVRSSSIATAGR